ncbi:MAG: 4'-phosphopantetheinyl transferase superfamily protein [Ginsengibacter sp.]
MPLFYQHNINQTTKLAIWHITEDENFFLEKVHLRKEIKHPHKRLQHFAGRYLLTILHPEFPLHLIEIAESNKPILSNGKFHFSISHCGDFAAAIISENETVGIDVEIITPKIDVIKNKFLSQEELKLLPDVNTKFLTLSWSCKEAVYKWFGKGGVDFKEHIQITDITAIDTRGTIECTFKKTTEKKLSVDFCLFESLCLAWVIG